MSSSALGAAHSLRFDRFEVRPRERRVLVDREPAALGARAFDILLALIERRDRLVPKSELLDIVWPDTVVEENNLQVHISALRKLLGQSAIATIPGRGYRFTLAPHDDTAADTPHSTLPAPLSPLAGSGAWDKERGISGPAPATRTNVPAAIEPLIGRQADFDALADLLAAHRLVTVLGPGGIGKTRLALEIARAEVGKRPEGTWWVDLASTTVPERIAATMANAAGLQLREGDPIARLADALSHSHLLLVLDNCEHLVSDVAKVAQAIVERAPGVTVLATSQIALHIPTENVYRLGTLDLPAADTTDVASARRHAAVQLLERRAAAADRRFALTDANVAAAVAICRALEGVALAIEMAAARVPAMGLDAVRARLDDRFRMLSGGSRVAQGRHRTLLATLDWSHALLSSPEQVVLRRIGAFAGSFGMDAANVLAQDEHLDEWAVLDALGGLIDKSLLQVEQLDPPRYRLLDTTRLYALDRLGDAGETAVVRARHASVMASLAQRALADHYVLSDAQWNARYAPDEQDLQAAFEHAVQHREPHVAAQTCLTLRMLDLNRGNASAFRSRMHACFALIPLATGRVAAELWDCVMPSDQIAIDAIARLEVARQRLAAWREQGDPQALCAAWCGWADELARAGDFAGAQNALQEAQALERADWPLRVRMQLPAQRSNVAMRAKDAAAYRRYRREVLALAEQAQATRTVISARVGLSDAALLAEDYEEAATLCRTLIDDLRHMNRPLSLGIALENLSNALVHLGDLAGAYAAAMESLPTMRRNEAGADLFTILALIAVRSGEPALAARMLGHVDAWVAASQYDLAPNEARAADEAGREIDAVIGAPEHARLRMEGAAMSETTADALAAQLRVPHRARVSRAADGPR
jgi:predicted ATPase/DNA-binding winged helix-turn-helix (wHTH) protein